MTEQSLFTGIEDADKEILLRIPRDKVLLKTCRLSHYTQKLCSDGYFWQRRFMRKYDVDLGKNISYYKIYRDLIGKGPKKTALYAASNGYQPLLDKMLRNISPSTLMYTPIGITSRFPFFEEDFFERDLMEAAILSGKLNIVQYLKNLGFIIYSDNLDTAAAGGNLEIVKYLIENIELTSNKFSGALYKAAKSGHLEIIKYLLQYAREHINIHLSYNAGMAGAIDGNNLGIVKYLIELALADPNIRIDYDQLADLAAHKNHLEILKYLVDHGATINNNMIVNFASYDNLEAVQYLMGKGGHIHAHHDEALRLAAQTGSLKVVKFLLKNGADIHAKKDDALKQAIMGKHLNVVKYLLKHGADWKKFKIKNPSSKLKALIEKYGTRKLKH